jgi:hypothetical protein
MTEQVAMTMFRPPAIYPANAPIEDLGMAELFTLSTLRLWTAPLTAPNKIHPDWRGGFSAANMDEQSPEDFDALLNIIAVKAHRMLDVRCARCSSLGGDEALMLQLVGVLQRDRIGDAKGILCDWLPPPIATMALRYAIRFAHAMARARLLVPYRSSAAASHVRLVHQDHAECGLARRH